MSLFEDLQGALKEAMLAKDEIKRETIRMVIAGCKNAKIELGRELTDDDVQRVITKAVKSRQDSAEQYDNAERPELAERERAEIAVLDRWLPKLLDEDATKAAVQSIVQDLGLESKKDMGRLMKELMTRHKGQVDGKLANRFAGEFLS